MKKIWIYTCLAFGIVCIALAVGLGVGLTTEDEHDDQDELDQSLKNL